MYNYFGANDTKPKGWLKDQLLIQAKSLSGNLDKVWPDVRDSAWIGGNKEGWERVPYWLDGFVPLAYILEDRDLMARADKYINAIIDQQCEDGWICPDDGKGRENYDIWALFLIGKVLALYCDFTKSRRAEKALYKAMKNFSDLLFAGSIKLYDWGEFRWYECIIPLQHLYERRKEQWILNLAKELRRQGTDYESLTEKWKRPLNTWRFDTHIVNICMMFKFEAVTAKLLGEKCGNKAEKLWQFLDKYNGTAFGGFTGDECLGGIGNNRGTELCAVVELMYCCELLFAITGKRIWADRLEKLAFNALPATISDDMWTHQYDQQVNQIACQRFPLPGKSFFGTNDNEAHMFGLEPHFGCCTANFNQGWPKLAMSVFLKTRGGILCSLMLPSTLSTKINGTNVKVDIDTEYPFRHAAKYTVETDRPVKFTLKIRLPKWAKSVKIDGIAISKSDYYTVTKEWNGKTAITVEFTDTPHFVKRPKNLVAVEYGALLYSLPIKAEYKMYEYEKNGVERKFPYCDYELIPQSEWRYGYADDTFDVIEKIGDDVPFSSKNPKVALKTKVAPVKWEYAYGYETVANDTPVSRNAEGPVVDMELIPYGCAKLRMTELPKIKK